MPHVKTNGIQMYYEERGQGEPLILLMGLGGDGSLWEKHVRAYESYFRCILVDNRGVGRSDKPEGPYTTGQMAQDVLGLMNSIGIDSANVSGISMGSAVAQEMALARPQAVKSLTLISSWDHCDTYATRIFETLRDLHPIAAGQTFARLLQLIIFAPDYHERHLDEILRLRL